MTSSEAEKFIEAAIGDEVGALYMHNGMMDWRREFWSQYGKFKGGLSNDEDPWKCNQCNKSTTSLCWCQTCNSSRFREEFDNWESGNNNVDSFIRDVQLKANSIYEMLEWIPYSNFQNITYLAEGSFGKVYSAEWYEGCILYWSQRGSQWKRQGTTKVALKCFNDSQNITEEFLNEIQNLRSCSGQTSYITRCYGITRHDETNNFVIVIQLIEDELIDVGDLRKRLSYLRKMQWEEKFRCLSRIAKGLSQMHGAELVHEDFHTGNILLSGISNNLPYEADFGLNKPVNEFAERPKKVYGVLPYVAPEVLRGEEYTKAADVYAFGVIMSEVISGTPPFKDVPHNKTLALKIQGNEKLRPKISRNTPNLVIELMQKCWDDNPQNRLSSYQLRNIFMAWCNYKKDSELAKQIEESKKMVQDSIDIDEIHPGAIYISRCLTDELEL